MEEVDLAKAGNAVANAYIDAWRARYYEVPPLDAADRTFFKDLARNYGTKKAVALVRHYLDMPTAYFLERAHSAYVLRTALVQVMASFGFHQKHKTRPEVRIATEIACNYCPPGRQNYVQLVGTVDYVMEKAKRQCTQCKAEGREVMCTPAGEPISEFMRRLKARQEAAAKAKTDPLGPTSIRTILDEMGVAPVTGAGVKPELSEVKPEERVKPVVKPVVKPPEVSPVKRAFEGGSLKDFVESAMRKKLPPDDVPF